ncbi:endo-1,4-beta-xylanase [Actinosynnema sp. NPDC004786]
MKKSIGAVAPLATALLVTALLAAPQAHAAAYTLKDAAAATGRVFGAVVPAGLLDVADYTKALDQEFGQVTPENEMKWNVVERVRGKFDYAAADRLVDYAESRGMAVRGSVLAWHSQLPGWVINISSGAELLTALREHIAGVAGHFRGRVDYWNVVNEAFGDSGARRNSVFQERIGDRWVEEAFLAAEAADPTAKLCYNDYYTDGFGPKSDAVYGLVRDFIARGVPIDCVGFQGYFTSDHRVPADMAENLRRFADLGVDVHLTELNVTGSGETQAKEYAVAVSACLAVPRCTVITVGGVTDKYYWNAAKTPLLIDADYGRKPAYFSVLDALNEAATGRR